MKTIPLTRGKFAKVDDSDFEEASKNKWYATKRGTLYYAVREIRTPNGGRTSQYLHRMLLPDAERIDHIDGDGLNNSKKNLRPATFQQNIRASRRKKFGATSRFRGVNWNAKLKKWVAAITVNYRNIHLGIFESEIAAARKYDAAAREIFKEFASPNFSL